MKNFGKSIILMIMAALALSACGGKAAGPTPTIDAGPIETAAVGTFAAGLTQTALSMPTETPTITTTFTPAVSRTPLLTATLPQPTASCYGLTLVSDVTIPDGTAMNQGQTFVKTWRVQNIGTCTWEAGFKFLYVAGESMGGAPFVLTTPVSPGANMDISISMTAPSKSGVLAGHWRMSTAAGALFGVDVYVKITVSSSTVTATGTATRTATATVAAPTSTETATASPTATATP
jgi:hypothetical protein